LYTCRKFDWHFTRFADARARVSAGIRIEINTAMIPITTRSSTSVKPLRDRTGTSSGNAECRMMNAE
jgi:hypothetical protein